MSYVKRILLVEDNLEDIELTLAALEEYHLTNNITVVRDGAEALDYLYRRGQFANLDESYPVVVLLDVKLPKVDGLEVLAIMKQEPQLRSIPVVMLTSSREQPDLKRAYELGVNAYVVKPVDFQRFADAVKELGCFWALLNEPPPGSSPSNR